MKNSVTYKQVFSFRTIGSAYIKKIGETKDNKLTAAIKSVFKQLRRLEVFEDYNEEVNSTGLLFCSTDPATGNVLKDSIGNYIFTVENEKKHYKALRELLKKTVEIDQRIYPECDEFVKHNLLSDLECEAFSGIVITEIQETEE